MPVTRRQLLAGVSATAALTALSTPAWATIAAVAGAHTAQAPGDTVYTTGITTTGCNCFVAGVVYSGGGVAPTFTDSFGNSYTQIVSKTAADGSFAMYVAINATSGASHQFKSSGEGFPGIIVQGFSGVATANAIDLTSGFHRPNADPNQTTSQPGSITPLNANEMFVTFCECYTASAASITCADGANTFTVADKRSYPGGSNALSEALAYFLNTGTGALNPTWTFPSVALSGSGMVALSPTAIVFPTINYTLKAGGDLASIATNGGCAVTAPTWAANVATVTTDASFSLPTINSQFVTSVSAPGNSAWTGGSISNDYTATVTAANKFTYPLVGNPGAAPGAGGMFFSSYDINTFMGGPLGTPDFTFSSRGSTCSSTAADSTHIVLQSSDTTGKVVINHPVIWNGVTCLAIGQNGQTIQVGSRAGYPANFGGTPQSGDTYRIDPVAAHIFTIGTIVSGSHISYLLGYNHNGGAGWNCGPWVTSANNIVKFVGEFNFNTATPLGMCLDNGSAVVVAQGPGGDGGQDHATLLGINQGNVYFEKLQLLINVGVSETDGIAKTSSFGAAETIFVRDCVWRQDDGESTRAHVPWGDTSANWDFKNVLFVNTNGFPKAGITGAGHTITCSGCGWLSTTSVQTTVSSPVSSGTTIAVASTTGITAGYSYVQTLNNGSISAGALVGTIAGGNVILSTGSVTGSITAGTTLMFGSLQYAEQIAGSGAFTAMNAKNTTFLGFPEVEGATTGFFGATFTACAADSNPHGFTGLTVVSPTGAITTNSGTIVDARLPSGSPLRGIGTFDANLTLDIFGETRPNPPSPWPAEFINSGSVSSKFFQSFP